VSCVLNSYEGACCAKLRKSPRSKASAKPAAPWSAPHSDIDRMMLDRQIRACVNGHPAGSGNADFVEVSVTVAPDGDVARLSVHVIPQSEESTRLRRCISSAILMMKFAKRQDTRSFTFVSPLDSFRPIDPFDRPD